MHMTSLKAALIILLTESIELNINEGSSDMELSKKRYISLIYSLRQISYEYC